MMNKIEVRIYSCYKYTYERIYRKVLNYLYGKSLSQYDINLVIIDISNNGSRTVQSQRSLENYVTRAIHIYENGEFVHLVGVSNTNKDYDKKHEKELDPSMKYVFDNPSRHYHGNAYFMQGTPKLFNYYFEQKKSWPNLQLSFYLLDIELGIPSNKYNCLTWRELKTLGFNVLNIEEVDFTQYEECTGSMIMNKQKIGFSSFIKFVNDIAEISSKNSGNNPSFLQTYERCVIDENEQEIYYIDKYIYTFKALSAQGYDTLFRILCLKVLAEKEDTEIEFRLGRQYFGYTEDALRISEELTGPIKDTLINFGAKIKYVTNDEFLIEKNLEENAYLRSKASGNPRNQTLFRNNLRRKGMPIRCVLCGNDDPRLLKAAHIWEVSDIKNSSKKKIDKFINDNGLLGLIDSTSTHKNEVFFKKYCLTNSGENGIWLCGTHHDMFDSNYFCFESNDGSIQLLHFKNAKQLKNFVSGLQKGKNTKIPKSILTAPTKAFLTMRNMSIGV